MAKTIQEKLIKKLQKLEEYISAYQENKDILVSFIEKYIESLCSQRKSDIIGDMKKEYEATNYESDLTDEQWEEIKEFFPSGNKSKYHKRSLVEAVLYIVKTGCQWRMLPHDTVWSFYRRARNNGVWDKIMGNLLCI